MAVNPYQVYPIYDADHVKKYKNRKLGDLPPHIFAVADNAYSHMKREAHDQCVIIRYSVCIKVCTTILTVTHVYCPTAVNISQIRSGTVVQVHVHVIMAISLYNITRGIVGYLSVVM